MSTIVTRSGKGSPLTNTEVDANFTNLNTDKLEISGGTMTGDLSFGDNDKAIFGAGSDLEISSNGASAIIRAGNASSDIRVESDNRIVICDRAFNDTFAVFNDDGDVKLYYDNAPKLATTSTGIDVTGGISSTARTDISRAADVPVLSTTNLENSSAVGLNITYPTTNVSGGDGLAIAIGISGRGRSYIANKNTDANLDASNLAFFTENGGVIGERVVIDQNGGFEVTPIAGGHAVFNEGSVDADFRVESNNNTHMLFVDGGANKVGIGRDPQDNGSTLQVAADATASTDLQLALRGLSNENKKLLLGFDTTSNIASITSLEAGVTHLPLHLQGSEFVWNESGSNHDFRVESDSNTHMLFVDAGNNRVGIGTNSLGRVFNVYDPTTDGAIKLETGGNASNIWAGIEFKTPTSQSFLYVPSNDSTGLMKFLPAASEVLALSNSAVVVNEQSSDVDFRVESNNNTHMLFVDAGNDSVHIGGSGSNYVANIHSSTVNSPEGALFVNAAMNNSGKGVFIDGNTRSINENTERLLQVRDRSAYNAFIVQVDGRSVFNDDGSSWQDFRVESDTNTHALFVDAGNNRVGVATAGPDAVMDVNGDFKANYYRPLSATTQTSNNSLHFWKLGRLYLVGADAAEIVLHGTKQGYGTGGNIVGKTTILLRGGTSTTALDGIFYSEGQTSAATPPEVRYVPVGNNSFDIYVRHNTYSSLAHTVTTGGSWTPSLSDTGTGTAPSNSIAILAERSFWLGNSEVLKQNQTGTVINETSHDHDFRVESDNNTHALFVEAGANRVGINNNNPNSQLDISGAGVPRVTLTSTSGPYGYMEVNTVGSVGFGADPNGSGNSTNMAFNVDNVETARFYSDLNVFNEGSGNIDFRVESDSQSQAFFVDAGANHARFGPQPSYSGANANCGVLMEGIGGNGQTIITANKTNTNFNIAKVSGYTNSNFLYFYVAGASVGSIATTGTGTTYSTTSDRRLKDNIEPIADGTEKLMAMKPVTHTWKAKPEADAVHGFIAQEMQEVVPEAVSGEDGGEEMMSMDYGRITPVLVAALQEATNEIKALKQRVSELEAK